MSLVSYLIQELKYSILDYVEATRHRRSGKRDSMSHAYTIRNISRHATHIYDGEELIGYMQPSSSRTTGGWNAYYGSTYATTHKLSLYCVAVGYSQEKCLENFIKTYEHDTQVLR